MFSKGFEKPVNRLAGSVEFTGFESGYSIRVWLLHAL
jgi:hypothetical protein